MRQTLVPLGASCLLVLVMESAKEVSLQAMQASNMGLLVVRVQVHVKLAM